MVPLRLSRITMEKVLRNPLFNRILLCFYNRKNIRISELAVLLNVSHNDLIPLVNELTELGFLNKHNDILSATSSGAIIAYNLKALAEGPVFTFKSPLGRVLDIGCGGGRHLLEVEKCGSEILVGADISMLALQIARVFSKKSELVLCDAHYLPFRECSFDAVIAHGLFPAVDEFRAIGEISRVLTKNGELFLGIQGLGLFVRFFFNSAGLKRKVGSLLSIVNTLLYLFLGKKLLELPTFQVTTRVQRLLEKHGLQLTRLNIKKKKWVFMEIALITAQKG